MNPLFLAIPSKIIAATFLLAFTYTTFADVVTLTNKSGKSASFTLIDLKDGLVDVKLSTGRPYQLKLEDLDEPSQKLVNDWVANGGNLSKEIEIKFSSGKRSGISKNENYDDKVYNFSPTITLKNTSMSKTTDKLKIYFAMLGRPVNNTSNVSVKWMEIKDCPAIEPAKEITNKITSFRWEYDNRGYAKYGSRYLGYLAVIKNSKGEIVASKTLPESAGSRLVEHINTMRTGDLYDKQAKVVSKGSYYYMNGKRAGRNR